MCFINIGRVLEIKKEKALCNFDGVLKYVSIALLPMIKVGDDIVANSGFASEIIRDKKNLYKTIVSTDSMSIQIIDAIKRESDEIKKEIKIAVFSDIQNNLIRETGIKELLPINVKLIHAPNEKFVSHINLYIEKNSHDGAITYINWFKNIDEQKNLVFADVQAIDILKAILKILLNLNQKEKHEK